MKQLLLLCSFFMLGSVAFAQLELNPDEIVTMDVMPGDFEGIGHATIKNKLPQNINLRWERTNLEITEGWESAVCDPIQCYLTSVDSKDFLLTPNESGVMDVHVYPNGIEGSAVVEVVVYDTSNVNTSVTGLYYFNTSPNSVSEAELQRLRIYPNPTTGIFTLSNHEAAAEILVYALTGQVVKHFRSGDGQQYDIRDLPKGGYLLKLLDEDGLTVTTRLIQKQ